VHPTNAIKETQLIAKQKVTSKKTKRSPRTPVRKTRPGPIMGGVRSMITPGWPLGHPLVATSCFING